MKVTGNLRMFVFPVACGIPRSFGLRASFAEEELVGRGKAPATTHVPGWGSEIMLLIQS